MPVVASQTLTFQSFPPAARSRPSGLKATQCMASPILRLRRSQAFSTSRTSTASPSAIARDLLSALKATAFPCISSPSTFVRACPGVENGCGVFVAGFGEIFAVGAERHIQGTVDSRQRQESFTSKAVPNSHPVPVPRGDALSVRAESYAVENRSVTLASHPLECEQRLIRDRRIAMISRMPLLEMRIEKGYLEQEDQSDQAETDHGP